MRRIAIVLLILLVSLIAAEASAQTPWALYLSDPIQCGPPGSTLTFHGTIDNYTDRDLEGWVGLSFLLNSEGTNGLPLVYGNGYFATELLDWLAPASGLPALGHYDGPVLRMTWTDVAPDGFWQNGLFSGGFAGYQLSRDWQASVCGVPPVPEPTSLALLAAGLIGLLLRRERP